jgi:lactoylglutathione lyase
MLGLWSLGSAPIGLFLHVAFETSLEDVLRTCERLRSLGVTPLSFFGDETSEPSVIGWMLTAAVYLRARSRTWPSRCHIAAAESAAP